MLFENGPFWICDSRGLVFRMTGGWARRCQGTGTAPGRTWTTGPPPLDSIAASCEPRGNPTVAEVVDLPRERATSKVARIVVVGEAPPGFEPGVEVLQTSALPLGYGA